MIDIAKLGTDKQAFIFGDVLKTLYKLKLGEYDINPPSKIRDNFIRRGAISLEHSPASNRQSK